MSVCVSLCHFMSLSDLLPLSRCKVTKSKFGTVTFCHYLSPFVTFQQIAFSRCKVTEKKFGTVRICPHMSGNVRFCPHFFHDAKLRKEKLALSSYVHLCPFMSSYDIATPCIYVAKLRNRNLAMDIVWIWREFEDV